MLNAFWPSQVRSKIWLSDWVKSYLPSASKIIIFGAWYGVLADLLDIRLKNSKREYTIPRMGRNTPWYKMLFYDGKVRKFRTTRKDQ